MALKQCIADSSLSFKAQRPGPSTRYRVCDQGGRKSNVPRRSKVIGADRFYSQRSLQRPCQLHRSQWTLACSQCNRRPRAKDLEQLATKLRTSARATHNLSALFAVTSDGLAFPWRPHTYLLRGLFPSLDRGFSCCVIAQDAKQAKVPTSSVHSVVDKPWTATCGPTQA